MTAPMVQTRRSFGILIADYIHSEKLFERYFAAPEFQVLHSRLCAPGEVDPVVCAVYGEDGIRCGNLGGTPVELLPKTRADPIVQGADVILSRLTEISLVMDRIGPLEVPLVDSNLVYAHYVVAVGYACRGRVFKVGVVGGVGLAATVDSRKALHRVSAWRRGSRSHSCTMMT
ncbi:hypothetical protein [Paraburkholderia caffeinilytica]|uniref:Uncharacterized protein n=1 Tax=Paraburkholderia caffeinilytica TaxID=1761016 RepID=A0ABQ1LMR2_9BURK|nr:hypothetical protein [Paraburkholderia caffeinilytica]GGC26148.1 hypothetical protein GCM10011400_10700 [Paraburkholderia caffeinilytica]CAB3807866.1 hypothetical protein LMG28690_06913 [Paraburkholderia caffeinilytica]